MITKTIKTEIKEGKEGYCSLFVTLPDGSTLGYDDLTRDRAWLESVTERLEEGELSLLHIADVLEDMLP